MMLMFDFMLLTWKEGFKALIQVPLPIASNENQVDQVDLVDLGIWLGSPGYLTWLTWGVSEPALTHFVPT